MENKDNSYDVLHLVGLSTHCNMIHGTYNVKKYTYIHIYILQHLSINEGFYERPNYIYKKNSDTNSNRKNEFKLSDVNVHFNIVFHFAFLNKTKILQCSSINYFLPHDTLLVTMAF